MFASESWAVTGRQTERMECVHASCLGQLLHVRLSIRRSMVYRVTHPDAVGAPLQRSHAPSHYRQQQSLMRQQRLQQMYPVTSEPLMIAGVGWQCPCGRIHPTRECSDTVVQLRAISDQGLGRPLIE
jgi:hypothetical protein